MYNIVGDFLTNGMPDILTMMIIFILSILFTALITVMVHTLFCLARVEVSVDGEGAFVSFLFFILTIIFASILEPRMAIIDTEAGKIIKEEKMEVMELDMANDITVSSSQKYSKTGIHPKFNSIMRSMTVIGLEYDGSVKPFAIPTECITKFNTYFDENKDNLDFTVFKFKVNTKALREVGMDSDNVDKVVYTFDEVYFVTRFGDTGIDPVCYDYEIIKSIYRTVNSDRNYQILKERLAEIDREAEVIAHHDGDMISTVILRTEFTEQELLDNLNVELKAIDIDGNIKRFIVTDDVKINTSTDSCKLLYVGDKLVEVIAKPEEKTSGTNVNVSTTVTVN